MNIPRFQNDFVVKNHCIIFNFGIQEQKTITNYSIINIASCHVGCYAIDSLTFLCSLLLCSVFAWSFMNHDSFLFCFYICCWIILLRVRRWNPFETRFLNLTENQSRVNPQFTTLNINPPTQKLFKLSNETTNARMGGLVMS